MKHLQSIATAVIIVIIGTFALAAEGFNHQTCMDENLSNPSLARHMRYKKIRALGSLAKMHHSGVDAESVFSKLKPMEQVYFESLRTAHPMLDSELDLSGSCEEASNLLEYFLNKIEKT